MKERVIALYLPQFHPIPENDLWWGKGFTEWTNVGKARPLFRKHYQPRVPADLGYYDLRLPEVRESQVELAKEAGIEGFCYYHYWFGKGRQLLERPFNEVVSSGKPDFPFCLCWANHSWTNRTWDVKAAKVKPQMLMRQSYGGYEDYRLHFNSLLSAFRDDRYMTIDNKLIFVIYDPFSFADISNFMKTWHDLARGNEIRDFYFIAMVPAILNTKIVEGGKREYSKPDLKSSSALYKKVLDMGFDGINSFGKRRGEMLSKGYVRDILELMLKRLNVDFWVTKYDYERTVSNYFPPEDAWENVYPTILPQWDRTARVGKAEGVYVNSTPEKFKKHVKQAFNMIKNKKEEHRIVFLKSWNEWAEGNYMEPDIIYGHGYLQALREAIEEE